MFHFFENKFGEVCGVPRECFVELWGIGVPDWIFQQDNAEIHTPNATKHFLVSFIHLRNEKRWAIPTNQVFKNGRQYNTV